MSLSVDARHCGAVYVIRCSGRIVAGEQSTVLEAAINRGLREFRCIVVDLEGVRHLDSSGIGLLVRHLSQARSRGGDLRLSTAPPFVANVIQATRLNTVFKMYRSEEDAVVSFLKEPGVAGNEERPAGPRVLFVDRSADVCAFVRALLDNHGYAVLSSCRMTDAKLLLAAKFDYLVLGAECWQGESATMADKLKTLAGSASIVQLSSEFSYDNPERATAELLGLLQRTKTAKA
jgi:anti-sigma B factor antagonist